jgi:threonine synthase
MSYVFECLSCGATTDPDERPAECPECGGRLEVVFEPGALPDDLPDSERTDLWRYADFLPTEGIDPGSADSDLSSEGVSPTSMGEGWTPLVDAPHLSETAAAGLGADGPDVFLKNEAANPTWSWKDRLAALVIPHAVAGGGVGDGGIGEVDTGGETRVATASTGNHASAVAAYASRAGIERTLVFVHPSSEPPHHRRIRAYGAESLRLSDYGERKGLLRELADRGWFVAYDLEGHFTGQPYVYEGYKTIAFEIVEQLGGVPDAVVVPVGAGDGFYGIWKGFRELFANGIVAERPRMVSAESEERHPLAAAYEADAESVGRDDGPEPLSTSTMGTTSGDHTLGAVRASGGAAYAADRESVEAAIRACGRDGVFLEPASALAPAAVSQAVEAGVISEGDTVVAVGTGAGVAWPEKTAGAVGESPTVDPSLDAIADAVPFSIE